MRTVDDMGFGLTICQDTMGFRYGIDAVLLAHFAAKEAPAAKKAADLGMGNGAVSLVLSHKLPAVTVTGYEIQEGAVSLAKESIERNGLGNRIDAVQADVKDLPLSESDRASFDLVVMNPPYVKLGAKMVSREDAVALARHEVAGTLEDFLSAAAALLGYHGSLCVIYRPQRLVDLFTLGRKHRLEPKAVTPVAPREGEAPNLILVRLVKEGGAELSLTPPLYVYEGEGYHPYLLHEVYER